MNEYISKPFDPKVLYSKVVGALPSNHISLDKSKNGEMEDQSYATDSIIDLTYLNTLAKGNQEFISEMIRIFMQQTPAALQSIKTSLDNKDWKSVRALAHKMKPSFAFMGIHSLKDVIHSIEEFADKEHNTEQIPILVSTLELICNKALAELELLSDKKERKLI